MTSSESAAANRPAPFLELCLPAVFLGIIALALQIGLYFSGISLQPGELSDPDCYMRLVRVGQLAESGNWFDGVIPRIDPPNGAELHWSRPLDVVILAGSIPFLPFTSLHQALFWSGVLCSPVLQVLTLLVLVWAVAPMFDERRLMLCCLIFLCQPGLINYFQAGRADHHSLLMFLLVAGIGFSIRFFLDPFSKKLALLCGAIHALALWVSIESLAATGVVLIACSLLWVFRSSDIARRTLYFCLGLTTGCAVAVMLESSPGLWFRIQLDKLSIIHVFVFGTISIFWMFLRSIEGRGRSLGIQFRRLCAGLFCFLCLILLLQWTVPDFLHGPYAGFDPILARIWLANVIEAAPLVPDWAEWNRIGIWLFPTIPSGILLFFALLKKTGRESETGILLYLALGGLLFTGLAFDQSRWAANAEAFLVFPLTELTARICIYLENKFHGLKQRLLCLGVTFLACGGFIFFAIPSLGSPAVVAAPGSVREEISGGVPPSSFKEMSIFLRGLSEPGNSRLILAQLDLGPEILYRTQHSIVSATYFRQGNKHSQDLMRSIYEIMTSPTDEEARHKIAEAHVDYLLLMPSSPERSFYGQAGEKTFYERLLKQTPPPWLQTVPLPGHIQGYKLFKVGMASSLLLPAPN